MWFYVDRIWAPPTAAHFSDLYPSWYGARELLLEARDPYGPEVSREIQLWSYGRAEQDRFSYPLYVVFLLAPVVGLPFTQVAHLFRWILTFAATVTVPLWLYTVHWRCSRALLGSLTLLSLGSFPVLESAYLQQPVLLAAAFLAGAGASLAAGRLFLAGVLLAFATIKPQIAVLMVPWLILWAVSGWRTRRGLIWGFGITMLAFSVGSEILLPGWIGEFLAGIATYQHYTGNFSILELLFGRVGGAVASLGLLAGLTILSWKMRLACVSSRRFIFVFCVVLVVTVVVIPTLYPTNQIVLLPAIILLLRESGEIWRRGRAARLSLFASACMIGWPWLGALSLVLARAFEPITAVRRLWLLPISSIPLIPLSLLFLFTILTPALFEPLTDSHTA